MSIVKRTHPLELPEILTRVAYYLPVWVQLPNKYTGQLETEFKPAAILSCMRVSKLWYQIMLPLLWHTYSGPHFARAPIKIVHRFSPHFRVFRSYLGHEGPFQCTGLVELNMSQHGRTSHGNGVDLETQCSLVASNRDLRKLYWHGPSDLVPMDVNSLTGLRKVDDMMLLCWEGTDGLLAKVLQAVSGTVTRLGIYSIHGVAEGDLMADAGNGAKEPLVLPHVVKLSYRINHDQSKGLEELVRCCPNLKKLYIIPEYNFDMKRLSKNIQECCHKMEALTVKYADLDDKDVVALLWGCRVGPGLVRLNLTLQRLSDAVTDAILVHSRTLQSVKLDIRVRGTLDVKNMLRILVECRYAWRIDIRGCGTGSLETLLSTLKSQPWGCKDLEIFGLRLMLPSPSLTQNRGDSRNEEPSEETKEKKAREEEARLEAKASRLFGMGWKVGKQRNYFYDGIGKKQVVDEVVSILGLVEGLKRVKAVQWNDIRYEPLAILN
ncbi:hypothetical protein BGZ88_000273 [Linnemannia elongata]|nr:hypothetical protein BGZ88_000273 [Linnemannia elongata]